jgi:hypothetical protein
MSSRIAERLMRVRERQMVGRNAELALFRATLAADDPPFLLLHISGPDGIGKTTLLRAFQGICEQQQMPALLMDARNIEATPEEFLRLVGTTMGLPPGEDPLATLGTAEGRRVLLVDSYENLEPIDNWVRDVFVPQLSADTLVVFAGMNPLPLPWRTDPGWQSVIRTVALRNLTNEESIAYMANRGVPESQHRAALDFTHGYPLALSLVADVVAHWGDDQTATVFEPEAAPHMVQALLERFVHRVPGPAHRAALEISAMVRLTSESLLTEALEGMESIGVEGGLSAHELFQWLRGLSFMESNAFGLFPHDVAREALLADLRWRNRERYAELHRRARLYYNHRLESGPESDHERLLFDYIFLHRDNPVIRSAFTWQDNASIRTDVLRSGDTEKLVAMVAHFEGEESARIAEHWIRVQPESVVVFRDTATAGSPPGSSGVSEPVGLLILLALHRTTPEERDVDPATVAAWKHLTQTRPLRPGEVATHFRFWMARGTYHSVSPVQSRIVVHIVRHYLTTRGLAFTFFPVRNPELWKPVLDYAEIPLIPNAGFTVGGNEYAVFGNDWRQIPPPVWLSRLAEKETAGNMPLPPSAASQDSPATLVVLSEGEFQSAVRSALRCYTETDALRTNPLIRSRLVVERSRADAATAVASTDGVQTVARIATLRALIHEAVASLQNTPRHARAYRPLYHTYIQPAPSQERVAEMLDLPFSTYRRHLGEGIAEVTHLLWLREIGEVE